MLFFLVGMVLEVRWFLFSFSVLVGMVGLELSLVGILL